MGVGSRRAPLEAAARDAAPSMRSPGGRSFNADVDPLFGSWMETDGLDAAARLAGERAFSEMALDPCAVDFGVISGCVMLVG